MRTIQPLYKKMHLNKYVTVCGNNSIKYARVISKIYMQKYKKGSAVFE